MSPADTESIFNKRIRHLSSPQWGRLNYINHKKQLLRCAEKEAGPFLYWPIIPDSGG